MNSEICDGYLIDVETGEVLGLAGKPEFHVTDRLSAEWVLEKIGQNRSALEALDARQKKVLENFEAQRQDILRREEWLNYRFGSELQEWARSQLGQKRKSLQLDHGKIGFRWTKGSVRVFDQVAAVAWLKAHCEQAVVSEPKVLVSKIPDELRDELPANAFDVTKPENKFYVL